MLLSTVFQSYHGNSSHYSCLPWVSPVLGWGSEVSCTLENKAFENIMEKEIMLVTSFFYFSTIFSSLSRIPFPPFSSIWKLLSVKSFRLEESEVHCVGKKLIFNSLRNDKTLDQSNFKELADNKINVTKKLKFVLEY